MGPPTMTLRGSSRVPQKASTSAMGVPIGTSRFFGCATASPATVSRLFTSGIPVFRNLPMLDTVVTFSIMPPTLVCRAPRGTVRPVAL